MRGDTLLWRYLQNDLLQREVVMLFFGTWALCPFQRDAWDLLIEKRFAQLFYDQRSQVLCHCVWSKQLSMRDRQAWTNFQLSETIFWLWNTAGLRGAICYALSLHLELDSIEKRHVIVTTSLIIVLFTILVLGGSTYPVVKVTDRFPVIKAVPVIF